MHKIYTDKENIAASSVNAAKATLAGPLKSKPQIRKPFGNVGNTIQSRRPSPSSPLKANIKSSQKVLNKSSSERLVPNKKTDAETKNVSPKNDDDWPEIEHMPPFYEPEDNYEDIWPREERLSHDDLLSLKFLQNKVSYDVCSDSPDSPIEPYLLEFSALDQSMFQIDCLEEPSKLNDILRPVPSQGWKPFNNVGNITIQGRRPPSKGNYKSSLKLMNSSPTERLLQIEKIENDNLTNDSWEIEYMPPVYEPEDNYEGIWSQEERLSDDDLMSLKFLRHYASAVSPISPLDQSMFKMDSQEPAEINERLGLNFFGMDSPVQDPSVLNESLCPLPSP